MKLLVFAHTPPPHHGQSQMIKVMLEGLQADPAAKSAPTERPRIECYHINARLSEDLEDIGAFRLRKALLLFRHCVMAIACGYRHRISAFYYVPAPGKRAALYRDWLVMILCRPFFRHCIHHWHAVGLGDWLQREGTPFERWFSHRVLGRPALGIALAAPSMRDALWFRSRRVEIVPNGIPDPCPDCADSILPRRRARWEARRRLLAGGELSAEERAAAGDSPEFFQILYLAHCTAEKGIFDTLEAVAAAAASLRRVASPIALRLAVAGLFPRASEERRFAARIAEPDLREIVTYKGFVAGDEKAKLMAESDCLCFPTWYPAESQPVNVIEALAFGLPLLTTRWRAIPELLPPEYGGFVAAQNPQELAEKIVKMLEAEPPPLRELYLDAYTERKHLDRLASAFQRLEGEETAR